jgi:hypothetical protein
MRCLELLFCTAFLLFLLMVACDAPGCFWERPTDSRGLTMHRTSCHFYKRASSLASRRRQDRAREAVLLNLGRKPQSEAVSSLEFAYRISNTKCRCQEISAVRYARDRSSLKPIASCRLLMPTSMAREPCSNSSLAESQQNKDVEMDSNSGTMWDYTNSGLCLVLNSDALTNCSDF